MADMLAVLNTIRDNASFLYQKHVPEATEENINDVGSCVMSNRSLENEFLSCLVNKVAMQLVHNKTFKNPLAVLKKGKIPLGRNIEEIYTNPATGTIYDPSGADLLARNLPDTKTIYHTMNRQGKYKVTINRAQLIQAFTSYGAMEKLLNSIVTSLYSGDNIEEFILMKDLFRSAIDGNKIVKIPLEIEQINDADTSKHFIKCVKTVSQAMTLPSTAYNSYYNINSQTDAKPVTTWTPLENQVLIMPNHISVNVDIELLAQAFNVSYMDLKQRTLLVDSLDADGEIAAVLCDEAYVQVYDNLNEMGEFYNPEGLYQNFIWHHWQTYSMSLFANAVAFTLGSAPN